MCSTAAARVPVAVWIAAAACIRSTDPVPAPGEGVFISGTVASRDLATTELAPVRGAVVRLAGGSLTRATDDRGFFILERLPIGHHQLAIEVRNRNGRLAAGRLLEPVDGLFDGQTIDLGTIELRGTGSLSGIVRLREEDGSERPGAGALVVAAQTGFKAIAGEDGAYLLSGLPESTLDIVAFQAGHAPARAVGTKVTAGLESRIQDLVLLKTDEALHFLVRGSAKLTGRTDHSGIRVSFSEETRPNDPPMMTTTDAAGAFSLDAPTGVYRVRFVLDGFQTVALAGVAVLPEGVIGLVPVVLGAALANDLDGDGIPDAEDPDRDNDGCANADDRFPDDPEGCADSDNDGIADEVDLDDDQDGLTDAEEVSSGLDGWITNPLTIDTDGDAFPDETDVCPTVADDQMDSDGDGKGDVCDFDEGMMMNPRPPEIIDFTPVEGPAGTIVTINGRNFVPGALGFNAVRFGQMGPIVTVPPSNVTASMIVVEVPRDAITGQLLVLTGGRVVTSTPSFTFLPAPEIVEFSPHAARKSAVVTVIGRNFRQPNLALFIGGTPAPIEQAAPGPVDSVLVGGELLDRVKIRVPVDASTGPIGVNTDQGTTNTAESLVVLEGPRILRITPNPAPRSAPITVLGEGFSTRDTGGMVMVQFSGTAPPVPPSSPPTDTSMRLIVPDGAANGPVTLIHPAGNSTTLFDFVVDPNLPYILELRPTLAKINEPVTLTGGNLDNVISVSFNGVPATNIVSSTPGSITVDVPTGAMPGPIYVTLPMSRTATSPESFTLLERGAIHNLTNNIGHGFSPLGDELYVIDGREGVTLSSDLSMETAPRVSLNNFVPGGANLVYFQVSPSGLYGVLVQVAPSDATYVISLPSFTVIGSCPDAFTTTYGALKFDATSSNAYAAKPESVGTGRDGVFRIELATATCSVLGEGPQMGAQPYRAVLPGLDPFTLYVSHPNLGLAVMDVQQGSPLYGTFTTPFEGAGMVGNPLFWGPGFRTIWGGSSSTLYRYNPFSPDPPFTVTGANGGMVQSENLRWLIMGTAIMDLSAGIRVRQMEPSLFPAFGGAARGTAVVVATQTPRGIVRYDFFE